uniref:Venom protein n=1 Tax=Scolopendra viridis TaxID=118503 RepID=A0A4D5RA06_SCOVI
MNKEISGLNAILIIALTLVKEIRTADNCYEYDKQFEGSNTLKAVNKRCNIPQRSCLTDDGMECLLKDLKIVQDGKVDRERMYELTHLFANPRKIPQLLKIGQTCNDDKELSSCLVKKLKVFCSQDIHLSASFCKK